MDDAFPFERLNVFQISNIDVGITGGRCFVSLDCFSLALWSKLCRSVTIEIRKSAFLKLNAF